MLAINDFMYELPDERIAKYPLPERDAAKLLVWRDGRIDHRIFSQLPGS
jgi:S-adenosylmethionine:tRNA ribosyltransferase-isomerase